MQQANLTREHRQELSHQILIDSAHLLEVLPCEIIGIELQGTTTSITFIRNYKIGNWRIEK